MPFPIRVGDRSFATAPQLASAVTADAKSGGGTVVPGRAPSRWLIDLVRADALERDVAVGLAAALIRSREAAIVCEGARLAALLADPKLAELLPVALAGHDTGLLLHADPAMPGQSVEDALLRAWAVLAPVEAPAVRGELLDKLRHAGLTEVEAHVLAVFGAPDEIRRWLPVVLIEGLPGGATDSLAQGLRRGGAVAVALGDVLGASASPLALAVWQRLASIDPAAADLVRARVLPGAAPG